MKQLFKVLSVCAMAVGLLGCIAAPIEMTPQTEQAVARATADPLSADVRRRPQRLEFLEPDRDRARQPGDQSAATGIKAVFFVQTRASRAGASDIGRAVMHRERDAGHILAFHTATPSHTNHRSLDRAGTGAGAHRGLCRHRRDHRRAADPAAPAILELRQAHLRRLPAAWPACAADRPERQRRQDLGLQRQPPAPRRTCCVRCPKCASALPEASCRWSTG